MFLKNQIRVRFSDEATEKMQELKKKFPLEYRNNSDIVRAGIFQLYKQKIDKGGKNF